MDDISFKLGLDAKGFQRGITSLKAQMKDFSREQASAFKQAFSVGAAVAALGALGERMLALKRQAEDVGSSTDFLQSLERLSVKFGGTAEDAGNAMVKLSEAIGKARLEGGPAEEKFTALGIALEDANGNALNTEQVFKAIATRYKETTDATQRAAIAFEFFGKTGRNINNILGEGADGIDAYTRSMRDLWLVAGPSEVNALADAWTNLKTNLSGIGANVLGRAAAGMGFAFATLGAMAGGANQRDALNIASEQAGITGQQAEAAQRALEISQRQAQESKRIEEIEQRREKLARESAAETDVERLEFLKGELQIARDLMQAETDKVKRAEKRLELERAGIELQKEQARQAQVAAEFQMSQMDAMNELIARGNRAATAKQDRTAFSLEELANANLRGVSDPALRSDVMKAKQVRELEARAERERLSGKVGGLGRAQSLLEQADALRAGIKNLRSEEREIQQTKDLNQVAKDIREFNELSKTGWKIKFAP